MVIQEQKDRFITVRGSGKVTARPDLTILDISLVEQTMEYEQTMKRASAEIDLLRKALVSIGYDRKDLKTTNFKISSEYESYHEGNGKYRKVFSGYRCTHSLKLEFDFDTKRLGETLKAITTSEASPSFRISFSVKDKKAVSEELLVNAIKNASEKAEILTKAAGVRLGTIQNIDYSWGELRVMSKTRFNDALSFSASLSMEIEPEDIDVDDSVTVVWSID